MRANKQYIHMHTHTHTCTKKSTCVHKHEGTATIHHLMVCYKHPYTSIHLPYTQINVHTYKNILPQDCLCACMHVNTCVFLNLLLRDMFPVQFFDVRCKLLPLISIRLRMILFSWANTHYMRIKYRNLVLPSFRHLITIVMPLGVLGPFCVMPAYVMLVGVLPACRITHVLDYA